MVQVAAMLVASINLTKRVGDTVKRGDEMGYYAFGGSTVGSSLPRKMPKLALTYVLL
jgi:phosphatidylserine decarboxylase